MKDANENSEDRELPEEIRRLDEAPFHVVWKPLLFIPLFRDQESGKRILSIVEAERRCHCIDLEDIIQKTLADVDRGVQSSLNQAELAVEEVSARMKQICDLRWKQELLERKQAIEKASDQDLEGQEKGVQKGETGSIMRAPFRAFDNIFIADATKNTELVFDTINAGLEVAGVIDIAPGSDTDSESSSHTYVSCFHKCLCFNTEQEDVLFKIFESSILVAEYGSSYRSILPLSLNEPLEDDQELVDALLSLVESARGLCQEYESLLSSSKIYPLSFGGMDTSYYRSKMQGIKENEATIPTIVDCVVDQVCESSELETCIQEEEYETLASYFIRNSIRSATAPAELPPYQTNSPDLDFIFLHHLDNERAAASGMLSGNPSLCEWRPEVFSAMKFSKKKKTEATEAEQNEVFCLEEVLKQMVSQLPEAIKTEQESNIKSRRHVEYHNPVVLEQVLRKCNSSSMQCYKQQLSGSEWNSLVYLHDLEELQKQTSNKIRSPPSLYSFSLQREKSPGVYYAVNSSDLVREVNPDYDLYPGDVVVKSAETSFVLTKDEVCFSFIKQSRSEGWRAILTYKDQTVITYSYHDIQGNGELEVTFTRADGVAFTITNDGKIKVAKPNILPVSFHERLSVVREGNWFEVDPSGYIAFEQESDPPKYLFKNGGMWQNHQVDDIAGGLYTDKKGARYFAVTTDAQKNADLRENNGAEWYEVEALESFKNYSSENGEHESLTREDFFLTRILTSGSEAFFLSNGVSIERYSSDTWRASLGADIPPIDVAKNEIHFEPCPGFELRVRREHKLVEAYLPDHIKLVAKEGVVTTNVGCRLNDKKSLKSEEQLNHLLTQGIPKQGNQLEENGCYTEGLLHCDFKVGQSSFLHDKTFVTYCGDANNKDRNTKYFDPTWTDPRIFLISPNGHGFEILSYAKAIEYLTNAGSNFEEIFSEFCDQDSVYLRSFFAPKGSKTHTVLCRHFETSAKQDTTPKLKQKENELTLPTLQRPSQPTLQQLDVSCPKQEPTSKVPVVVFRQILELTLSRDTAPQLLEQDDVKSLELHRIEDPGVRYVTEILDQKRKKKQQHEAALRAAAKENEKAKKEWKPWPLKEDRFADCPKIPRKNEILKYFDTQEGIIALEAAIDPVRENHKISGTNKAKRSSAGKGLCRGMYVASNNSVHSQDSSRTKIKTLQTGSFSLLPAHIDFGEIRRGDSVHREVTLTNLSPTRARFALPSPCSEITIQGRLGHIPAGLHRTLDVDFHPDRPGTCNGEIYLKTELNELKLTYSAKVQDS